MEEENPLDFSFWPAFADLMLALVLILVLVLFLVTAVIAAGTVNLSNVEKNQKSVVDEIAASYGGKPKELKKEENGISVYGISLTTQETYDLIIRNEPTLQRITFSDHILFQPDNYKLNPRGEEVLKIVGAALKKQLSRIREIQIQGHADPDTTTRFPSNVHLAALRAIEVYRFLQKPESAEIDPAQHLMSATSFGEFKPVQRSEDSDQYNQDKLREHNSTLELKGRNRRIELLLFYRL
jgi:flagellar motor protein MotB